MANPWAPDQTITVDHAEQLISKGFPELHLVYVPLGAWLVIKYIQLRTKRYRYDVVFLFLKFCVEFDIF